MKYKFEVVNREAREFGDAERKEALRARLSKALGVPIRNERDVLRWLDKYEAIKERGLF